jgi:hypothetical protein
VPKTSEGAKDIATGSTPAEAAASTSLVKSWATCNDRRNERSESQSRETWRILGLIELWGAGSSLNWINPRQCSIPDRLDLRSRWQHRRLASRRGADLRIEGDEWFNGPKHFARLGTDDQAKHERPRYSRQKPRVYNRSLSGLSTRLADQLGHFAVSRTR